MGQNFSSTAGSNPGAVNGEQTTAPGNSGIICSACSIDFNPEKEGGIQAVLSCFISVAFCPTCAAALQDLFSNE